LDTIAARLDTLEGRVFGFTQHRISFSEKARRLGICAATLKKRVDAGLVEKPECVRGRMYFWIRESTSREESAGVTEAMRELET
jgi:hypothetical protein